MAQRLLLRHHSQLQPACPSHPLTPPPSCCHYRAPRVQASLAASCRPPCWWPARSRWSAGWASCGRPRWVESFGGACLLAGSLPAGPAGCGSGARLAPALCNPFTLDAPGPAARHTLSHPGRRLSGCASRSGRGGCSGRSSRRWWVGGLGRGQPWRALRGRHGAGCRPPVCPPAAALRLRRPNPPQAGARLQVHHRPGGEGSRVAAQGRPSNSARVK